MPGCLVALQAVSVLIVHFTLKVTRWTWLESRCDSECLITPVAARRTPPLRELFDLDLCNSLLVMSAICMPLVIVNLGAEMVYILDQRLKAQCIAEDKSQQVLNDVVCTWFDNKFVEEMFKPQQLYTLLATRQIFEQLAHSSIMRLNSSRCGSKFFCLSLPACLLCNQRLNKSLGCPSAFALHKNSDPCAAWRSCST